MREIRQSGSEGGGAEINRPSLPLSYLPTLRSLRLRHSGGSASIARTLTGTGSYRNVQPYTRHKGRRHAVYSCSAYANAKIGLQISVHRRSG